MEEVYKKLNAQPLVNDRIAHTPMESLHRYRDLRFDQKEGNDETEMLDHLFKSIEKVKGSKFSRAAEKKVNRGVRGLSKQFRSMQRVCDNAQEDMREEIERLATEQIKREREKAALLFDSTI